MTRRNLPTAGGAFSGRCAAWGGSCRARTAIAITGVACATALTFGSAETQAQTLPAGYPPSVPGPSGSAPSGPAPSDASTATEQKRAFSLIPSITAQFEATNNVNPGSGEPRKGDFLTEIQPALAISERTARTSLDGNIVVPILLYARTGGENNAVRPEVSLTGKAELVQRLFYVEASANVTQEFVSPFGPQPASVVSATTNRNTAQSYAVSPYFKGDGPNNTHYELRDNNAWTIANGIAATGNSAYTNEILGHFDRTPTPLGFALDYDRQETNFPGSSDTLITEIERGRVEWRPTPDWQFAAIGGYENDRYPLANYTSPVYGAEAIWKPSDRTTVDAEWEHRFFGGSYHVAIQENTRLAVWSLRATRDITTYPQQLATLGAGVSVDALLNQLFTQTVPDAAQRQNVVDQLIRDRGLPSTLSSPLSLFSDQVSLQQTIESSVGLIGARNTIFFTAFRVKSEPVVSSNPSPIDLLPAQNNNTQDGANAVWTHRLTPLYSLTTSLIWSRTVANDTDAHSTQWSLQTTLSAPLSRSTSVFTGLRYQRFRSNVNPDFNEAAAFVGMTHVFQ